MKIRVEIEKASELEELLKVLETRYHIAYISKKYPNRHGKLKRVYIDVKKIGA